MLCFGDVYGLSTLEGKQVSERENFGILNFYGTYKYICCNLNNSVQYIRVYGYFKFCLF